MAEAGWYEDPGGTPGHYRYWDGEHWGTELTDDPANATPSFDPSRPIAVARHQPVSETERAGSTAEPSRRRNRGGWVVLAVVVLALVVGIVMLLNRAINNVAAGGAQSTDLVCPVPDSANASLDPHPADGRVYGGKLSYPQLSSPWSAPHADFRVPFGRDARTQSVTTEENYQPGRNWVAGILVAQLSTGDGFASPQMAIDTVATCIVGGFYGDNKVEREDRENRATTIDGHDAWYLDTKLSFSIKGLKATSEVAIIVIVRTAPDSMSIYYASIPNNAPPGLLQTSYDLVKQLKVS